LKICLIIDDYLPHSIKVGAKMMHELAVEFRNRGHQVTVITPGIEVKKCYEEFELDGILICQFRSGAVKVTNKIKRLINESLLSLNAWRFLKKKLRDNPHDLIVYYSPSIFWGYLVGKLKKLWNAPAYLILRDFFPQWVIDSGMLSKNSLITKYFRFFEKLSYRNANVIGIQSPANIVQFQKLNGEKYYIDLLYNWASDKPVVSKDFPVRKKLGLERKIVFFYGGNIGYAQDMANILRLAKNLSDHPDVHFVLVGAGDEVELVRETICNDSLKNVTLLDPVPQEEFKKMLSEFDVGLFSLHKNHTAHNFPGKVLGYMVQGMPILGCVNPGNDLKTVVEKAGAGFVSISGDDEKFLFNAKRLLQPDAIKKAGQNARNLLKDKFSVSAAAESIFNSLGSAYRQ